MNDRVLTCETLEGISFVKWVGEEGLDARQYVNGDESECTFCRTYKFQGHVFKLRRRK